MQKIDSEQKHKVLEEILKSKSFINSKLNSKLLTYLVECEIEKKSPNEYSIAVDIFHKDASFNANEDTLVRVSVYNLRKKLERYYQNMGKQTKIRVKIPKGQYTVIFFKYKKENIFYNLDTAYIITIPIIIVLLGLIIYLFATQPKNKELKDVYNLAQASSFLYSDFTDSQKPKIISLGNDFIYYSDFSEFRTTSIRKMYRNSNINSEEEFEKYKSEDAKRENLKKLPFSFFNQAAVLPLPFLERLLYDSNTEHTIKSTTELNSNDLKKNDIFFLGSFWTLGILEKIIKDLGITYNIIGNERLNIKLNGKKDSILTYERTGVPAFEHIDYSVFIKIPGPNNNSIYLIVSFYATGSVGTIKYLTKKIMLEELKTKLETKFETIPSYFFLVFKSNGFNREVLSTELLHISKINPKTISW